MAARDDSQSVGDFLAALHVAPTHAQNYVTRLAEAEVHTVVELTPLSEDRLVEVGLMRGHARRIRMELSRPTAEEGGMERHSSMLDPSPLATPNAMGPFFPGRRAGSGFPSGATSPVPQGALSKRRAASVPSGSGALQPQDFACFICMDFLNSPRTVPCGHTFCAHCLAAWNESHHRSVCPLCRMALCPSSVRFTLPPVNKMLDDIARKAFPDRYIRSIRLAEQRLRDEEELRMEYSFTRHPGNALLVKIHKSLPNAGFVGRPLELAMLRIPRMEFCPVPMTPDAAHITCPGGPTRVDGLGFNVTAASIQALVLYLLDIKPGHTVLDVGTGSGLVAAWASQLSGPTGAVLAVDNDPAACTFARRNIAIQQRHAVALAPVAPLFPAIRAGWWIHGGATLKGTVRLLDAAGSRMAGVTRPAVDEEPQEQHIIALRLLRAEEGRIEGIVCAGKERQRVARVQGKVQFADPSPKAPMTPTRTVVRRRTSFSEARTTPNSRSARSVTATDSPNSAPTPPDGASVSLRLVEVALLGDDPHDMYCFEKTRARRGPSSSVPSGPTAATSLMHYTLKLANTSLSGTATTAVDGHVGFTANGNKAVRLGHLTFELDEATAQRLSAWEKTEDSVSSPATGVSKKSARPREGTDSDEGERPAASPLMESVRDTSDEEDAAPIRDDEDALVPTTPQTPPSDSSDEVARTTGTSATAVTPQHGAISPLHVRTVDDPLPTPAEAPRAAALGSIRVLEADALELGREILSDRDTVRLLDSYLRPHAPPPERAPDGGFFDRMFVGCEPNNDAELDVFRKLVVRGGRFVVPYSSRLMLVTRLEQPNDEGEEFTYESAMDVSFGALRAVPQPGTRVREVLQQEMASGAVPVSPCEPRPLPGITSTLTAPPRVEKRVTHHTRCCLVPAVHEGQVCSGIEKIIGALPELLPGSGMVVHSVPPSLAVHEGMSVFLPGLGCRAAVLVCPCRRVVGFQLSEEPLNRCGDTESWRGKAILCENLLTARKDGMDLDTRMKVREDQVRCKICDAPLGVRSDAVFESVWCDNRRHRQNSAVFNTLVPSAVTFGSTLLHSLPGGDVMSCDMQCAQCRTVIGYKIVSVPSALDVPQFCWTVERFGVLTDQVKGLRGSSRTDTLHRIFDAIAGLRTTAFQTEILAQIPPVAVAATGSSEDDATDAE